MGEHGTAQVLRVPLRAALMAGQPEAKWTHHDSHSFPVPDKVHVGLPALPFNDLGGGAGVVHGVGRHQVVPVRGPAEPQHVGRPSTLRETSVLERSPRPTL